MTTQAAAVTSDTPSISTSSRQVVSAVGLVGLALALIVNSVAGPLLLDAIDYPVSDSMRNQTIGLDSVALFLFAPACLITAVMAWRGDRLAPVLTVSLGSYVAYIFVQYLVGPEFEHYPATLCSTSGCSSVDGRSPPMLGAPVATTTTRRSHRFRLDTP